MPSLHARVRRATGFLLSDPGAVRPLVAFYILAGIVLALADYTINDEGLLTHYGARWAGREFVPVFFFQRIRPILCALYLPASAGGVHVTLIAHVLVASLSLPLLAASSRALGHRLPNLPALAVALSPLYFYGGPAGLSNADGVVGICLVVYLLCARRRPFLAGLVVGVLPWIRIELTLFSAAVALHGLFVRRDRVLLAGMPVFPLLYVTAGAFYHHDPLWVLHFPPAAPTDPSAPMWATQRVGARFFLEPLLALTPVAPLILALRPARLQAVERTMLFYFVVAAVLMNVLPTYRLANFGTAPRYSMAFLPSLALLAGRALDRLWEGERLAPAALVAMSVFALWLATRQIDVIAVAILLIAYALIIAAAGLRREPTAAALAVALIAVGPLLPLRLDVGCPVYLQPMFEWLRAHRDRLSGPVLTNSQLLAPYVESRLPQLDVRFVAWSDITGDLLQLSNPANGQRDRIRRLCETDLYGRTLFAPISPDDIPPGTLMALRDDLRLPMLLPDAIWGSRLEVLETGPEYRIVRVVAATPGAPDR
jgi:hypothetical protein